MSETGNINIDKMYQALKSGKQKYLASILPTASLITSVECFVTLNKYCHKDYMKFLTQAVNTHTHTHPCTRGGIKETFNITFFLSFFFYSHTMHLAIIKVLLPTDAQGKCFKRNVKIYIKNAPTCFGVITIIRERIIRAC